ncbi:arginine deiminase-related protein [Streptomyces sp. MspMP-M5]|uniref:dimethylarginine dimethylaminohydrolase family protein n=1 Tax=unclassified Streptomyces TaxID=2593676 RepID=UPI0003748F14|nr:arginine deiminase-related protein [Streptomyces sp. MspMP-M5]
MPITQPGGAPLTEARRTARPRRYLACRPTHFTVEYAINPWMREDAEVDTALALQQWENLVRAYRDHGHTVETIQPVAGLPDMVFAANSAVVVGGRAFGSLFHAPQRRPESREYEIWFKAAGYDLYRPESACEGEGDLAPVGRYLLAGTGFRTTRDAHAAVQEFFGRPVISLQLTDPYFYHLDTALFVLDDGLPTTTGSGTGTGTGTGTAEGHSIAGAGGTGGTGGDEEGGHATIAYYPEAFSPGSREVLRHLFPDAVLATRDDALAFGLNSVSDGRHVFIAPQATHLIEQLTARGYVPVPVDLSEFHKAGGGIKCCTQELRP